VLLAVLVGREEYTRLRQDASRAGRAELAELLEQSRQRAAEAGLDTDSVDEAIAATRRLR
jgi:hypothetical protein